MAAPEWQKQIKGDNGREAEYRNDDADLVSGHRMIRPGGRVFFDRAIYASEELVQYVGTRGWCFVQRTGAERELVVDPGRTYKLRIRAKFIGERKPKGNS